jgi:hypothetical protein
VLRGPADGALVVFPLLEKDQVYLVKIPRSDGRVEVHAYAFAERTEKESGNWVLGHVRYIGFMGMPPGK